MDPSVNLLSEQEEIFSYPSRYQIIIGKLNYLTISYNQTKHFFDVNVVSLFLNSPGVDHSIKSNFLDLLKDHRGLRL